MLSSLKVYYYHYIIINFSVKKVCSLYMHGRRHDFETGGGGGGGG